MGEEEEGRSLMDFSLDLLRDRRKGKEVHRVSLFFVVHETCMGKFSYFFPSTHECSECVQGKIFPPKMWVKQFQVCLQTHTLHFPSIHINFIVGSTC